MARCSGSAICNCKLHAGVGISIRGSGQANDPYIINAQATGNLDVVSTNTVALVLTGSGTTADPYILSADAHVTLNELDGVQVPSPVTDGYVLGYSAAAGAWIPQPPTAAAPGAVLTGNCLVGDGSSANRLNVRLGANPGLQCNTDGLTATRQFLQSTRYDQAMTTINMSPNQDNFIDLPALDQVYTVPPWAVSCVVDYHVQNFYCTSGSWAGSIGRLRAFHHGTTYRNFSGNGGYLMVSFRSGAPRGSSVSYRDILNINNLTPGSDLTLHSEMRATGLAGGGVMSAFQGETVVQSIVSWSSQ